MGVGIVFFFFKFSVYIGIPHFQTTHLVSMQTMTQPLGTKLFRRIRLYGSPVFLHIFGETDDVVAFCLTDV